MSLTLTSRGNPAPIARAPASRPRVHPARGAASHRRCKPHAFQRRPAVLGADSAADLGLDGGEYSRELETALEAVRLASTLCQDVQGQLMRMDEQAETKEDRSLVTLADYAAQAIISWCVRRRFRRDGVIVFVIGARTRVCECRRLTNHIVSHR